MLLSLRTKLIYLLVISGVVPLLAGLCFLLVEGRLVKRHEVGLRYRSMAESRSETLRAALHENAALAVTISRSPFCLDIAKHYSENVPLDSRRAAAVDLQWSGGKDIPDELTHALTNTSADSLRRILQASHRNEMFITDRFGRVVACSAPTSDYLQADETWWRESFNNAEPRVYVSPVNFDHSANVWSIDICAPILDADGKFQGVCKTVLDLERWISATASSRLSSDDTVMFIDIHGNILHDGNNAPFDKKYPLHKRELAKTQGCWHFERGMLSAISPMDLGTHVEGIAVEVPKWLIVIETPASRAMAVVNNLLLFIVISGFVVIAMAFVIGYIISDRQVIRPINVLRDAAAKLAAGENHHISLSDKSFLSREITQLLQEFNTMAQAVGKSREELEFAAELKSRFIRIAGHELKTPVAYIIAMAALMSAKAETVELADSAKNIQYRAKRLDQIISGMLKLAAEENFNFESDLTLEKCDSTKLIQTVENAIKPFIDNRGQLLHVETFDPSIEITIDHNKILDSLLNLLSNAIKFTPDSGTVSMVMTMEDEKNIRIDITDQGRGIDPKDMEFIFEPFWGGGNILNHSSGDFGYEKRGPGLGLPVARHFVQMHGGSIEVTNTPKGCTFSVLLPVDQSSPASA